MQTIFLSEVHYIVQEQLILTELSLNDRSRASSLHLCWGNEKKTKGQSLRYSLENCDTTPEVSSPWVFQSPYIWSECETGNALHYYCIKLHKIRSFYIFLVIIPCRMEIRWMARFESWTAGTSLCPVTCNHHSFFA